MNLRSGGPAVLAGSLAWVLAVTSPAYGFIEFTFSKKTIRVKITKAKSNRR